MNELLISTALPATDPPHPISRIAICALTLPNYDTAQLYVLSSGGLPETEVSLLTAWLHECATANELIFYNDRSANFTQALRRVVDHRLPVPFRAGRPCCRGNGNLVLLVDLEHELGELQYRLVPTIFRAVEPLLCYPDAWRHCQRRGNSAAQDYFAVAHAAATACLYLHRLLDTEVEPAMVDAAVAGVLAQLERYPAASTATLDISDLPA